MGAHGFFYQVEESRIFVRNRPKSFSLSEKDFSKDVTDKDDESDAYLSVTDTFVIPPQGKHFAWFPWNEGRMPIPEMYYATNRVLNWWIHYLKVKNIQVFCDGGSHRSVTVFGAYLRTYHTCREAEEIVKNRVEKLHDSFDPNQTYPDHATWAQPLDYVDSYLEKFPADRLLFRAMGNDRLGRLDCHSRGIYALVKERYGDNK